MLVGIAALLFAMNASAQAPAAEGALDALVGPIALYPDDLVAIILPASTSPLQIVQADRYLDKRKTDPKLPIDANWDDPVKSLLNYPDVVKKMSADLDWTSALGEAVVSDQAAVLEAVQSFRRRAQAAGNLKSDDKQVVKAEKEVIVIQPANPEVIYVPQYNPSTVVVYGAAPVYGYYPTPYPSYYYPYAPGAAMAAGVIWGAAIGAAWSGNHYGYGGGNNTINVNRNTNISGGNTNINRGSGSGSAWKSNKQPGQVSSSVGKTGQSGRVGDRGAGAGGAGAAGGARASNQPAGGGGIGSSSAGGARASTQPSGAGAGRDGAVGGGNRSGASGGSAFANSGASGRQTQMDSSRGASSRSSASSMGARSSPSGAGARGGGGGGGGGRGGGGGGRR
jgi:hypothetical protein